jgi:hypothetical protein
MRRSTPGLIALMTASAASAGPIYWTDIGGPAGSHTIMRANADGSGVETLVTGLRHPRGMSLDIPGGQMYWTEPGLPAIRRAHLDGTGVETVVGA